MSLFDGIISGAGSGASAGPVGAGIGALGGAIISGIGSLLGKDEVPEARGGGLWDGLQKPGAPRADASALTYNDAKVFADLANRYGLYVQEIDALFNFDRSFGNNSWMDVVNWFRDHPERLAQTITDYNAANPYNRLAAHPLGVQTPVNPTSGYGAVPPLQYNTPTLQYPTPVLQYAATQSPVLQGQPQQQNLTLPNVVVQTGGTNAPAETPNYALYGGIAGGVLLLFILILVLAFKRSN